jgi:hypothetical protein
MKIILMSCVSQKLSHKARAKELYISPLFKLTLKYANSLKPDKIFILSAKHGLISLDEEIEPYNLTLNNLKEQERKEWAEKVLINLKQQADLKEDEFIFLAGEKYRKHLLPHLTNYKIPMKGLGIGKQLQFLKNATANPCTTLHYLFNNMKKHSFPFNEQEIPKNGIYILFEKGEKGHEGERIVRIGTHTGQDQLPSRLKQHFLNENKDRSIFRKNIGRALLNKKDDPFLDSWELDLTTRDSKEKHKNVDFEKQKQVEKQVSNYIQQNFSFVVFPIENKEKRLEIESKIISTISLCKQCGPSDGWLGLQSPKQKIQESGLWLVNELYKQPLSVQEIEELRKENE